MDFPLFNTKELADGKTYNLTDPLDRKLYFQSRLGSKIDEVKEYLDAGNTFVGFLLAKKTAGKGTYSKMFEEIVGSDRVCQISVGDVVRDVHKAIEDPKEREALAAYLKKNYRGLTSIDDAIASLLNRSQDKVSIPTEFILALLKREIAKVGRKAVFIDGLPRTLDQISTALYFRDLINFRDDPDFFVLIDVPMAIIDARLKKRVVCPECRLARNLDFNPTGYVNYDAKSDEYFLLCDNSSCLGMGKTRLVTKDGDAAGIETIKERIESDGELIRLALNLTGVPKVLLRSSIPVSVAPNYVESFEIQPKFSYTWNGSTVEIHNSPWTFEDDAGVSSYSLMAPPVVVSMFEQVYKILIG